VKFTTYELDGQQKVGVVLDGNSKVLDLLAAAKRHRASPEPFVSMLSLIDAGDSAIELAGRFAEKYSNEDYLCVSVSDVKILAPLPVPRQMHDGTSFPMHILQAPLGMRKYLAKQSGDEAEYRRLCDEPLGELPEVYRKIPIYYITNRFSVSGPNTVLEWPSYSKIMDYELEFGIVTKGKATNIKASDARNHVFGYTIFNDFSARDAQGLEMQGWMGPAKGKSFDGGNVIGPWIVTPDEIGNPYALDMEAKVNGEVRSKARSEGMLFSFEEIIEHVTKSETLMPGEFIGSGTVGNGCGLESGRFLENGDVVELSVEKIGSLITTVTCPQGNARSAEETTIIDR
jgi:2-keto-4-pentenoate hydratase/2-oxohepta-3-ene-1,7-dioic acid hydratase in catechol pathway